MAGCVPVRGRSRPLTLEMREQLVVAAVMAPAHLANDRHADLYFSLSSEGFFLLFFWRAGGGVHMDAGKVSKRYARL